MSLDDVKNEWLRVLDNLEAALDHPDQPKVNTTGLMKQWGALMVETSHQAFEEQKFGDDRWPVKYPSMESPFINLAGALQDFKDGLAKPRPVQFDQQPALIGAGGKAAGLYASITYNVPSETSAEVSSNKSYARLHQLGGRITIDYDEGTRDRIRKWLYGKSKEKARGAKASSGKPVSGYEKHLSPLLHKSKFSQKVIRRTFLGVTNQAADDMIKATKDFLESEASGGATYALTPKVG